MRNGEGEWSPQFLNMDGSGASWLLNLEVKQVRTTAAFRLKAPLHLPITLLGVKGGSSLLCPGLPVSAPPFLVQLKNAARLSNGHGLDFLPVMPSPEQAPMPS